MPMLMYPAKLEILLEVEKGGGIKGVLAIRQTFSLVDMITNAKFLNCLNAFKSGVVRQ